MQTILTLWRRLALVLLAAVWPFACNASDATFVNVTDAVAPGLPQLAYSSVAWADFDNDGRLDFLLTGVAYFTVYYPGGSYSDGGTNVTQLWRNTGNGFSNVTATLAPDLPAVSNGSVAWGDYDNDGKPDFLITGYSQAGSIAQIWRNTGHGFSNVTATVAPGLPGVQSSSVAWGDYDKDGRLDFFITGHAGYVSNWVRVFISQIWRNTSSGFSNVTDTVAPGLPGVMSGSVAWGDFDNDGRLDFLITGGIPRRTDLDDDVSLTAISQLWRNTGSGFVNVTATVTPGLTPVFWSSVAWADFDNDGQLDFALTGYNRNYPGVYSQLWRNTANGFINVTPSVAPGLPWAYSGSVTWGDYDNDGRLDLLLTGEMLGGAGSQIWRNTPSGFTNVTATVAPPLPGVVSSSVAWGDYDNDGRLDLLLTGALSDYCDVCDPPPTVSQLWRNNVPQANAVPVVITKMPASASPTNATLTGAVNPHGQSMTVWFIWGNSHNYDHTTPAQPMGSGNSLLDFSETISDLSANQFYYYRAVGSNEQGQVFLGLEQSFYLTAPYASSVIAGNITANSATLSARVYPQPNNLPTYGWFEWGFAPVYDHVTPVQFLGSFDVSLSENIFGLEPNRAYYARAVVSNGLGVAYGPVSPFYTPDTNVLACPGSVSPGPPLHGYGGGVGYRAYFYVQCDWTAVTSNSWITITSPASGSGPVTITYNLAPNPDPWPRTGNIAVAGHVFWMTQAGGHPIIVTPPTNQTVFAGGTAMFTVGVLGANPTFQWRFNGSRLVDGDGISGVTTSNLLLNDVQISQTGEYRVDVGNTNLTGHTYSLVATLTVLCTYNLSSSSASFDSLSATGSVTLNSLASTCPWSIVNTNPWVLILSSLTNRGNGTVIFALAANPTTTARSGTILIADQIFTITQSGTSSANPDISLEEALDTEGNLTWSTIGTPAWFGQTLVSHDGVDAAQSGPITNGSAVTAVSTIIGPGTLSFWWKVSSQTNKDFLKFFINGVQQTRISGEVDWQSLSYTFPAGTYTSKWTYSKSDQGTVGNDRGWLDQVRLDAVADCSMTLSHFQATYSSASEMGEVSVTAEPGCKWDVITLSPWITNLVAAGEGNDVVSYTVASNSLSGSRTGTLIIAGQLFTITQTGTPCAYSISPSSRAHGYAATTGLFYVTTQEDCAWSAVSTNPWVTIVSGTNGSGNGVLTYSIPGNPTPYSRSGGIQIGDQFFAISQSGTPCRYSLSPSGISLSSSAATGSIALATADGCPWNVSPSSSWVTILSATNGSGSGQVVYSVPENTTSSSRSASIYVADQVFGISQAGKASCTYAISPASASYSSAAATGMVAVTTQTGCPWSVSTSNAWVTILSSRTNSGPGQVIYSISSNASSSVRIENMRIGSQIFTISQSGASGTNTTITLSEALDTTGTPLVWVTGGTLYWSGESAVSHDGADAAQTWVPNTSGSGSGSLQTSVTGPGTLSFWWKVSSETNNDTLRFYLNGTEQTRISGEVSWQQRSFAVPAGSNALEWRYSKDASTSAGQDAAWLDQVQFAPSPPCPVTLLSNNASYASSVSTGLVSVVAASDCTWNVVDTNTWIAIASGLPGTGNGTVTYVVLKNTTAYARTGNLRIADQIFTITQAGNTNPPPACAVSISPTSRTHGYASATGTVAVATQDGCSWVVVKTNSWISILSGLSNSNSGIVLYSITANTNSQARSAYINISGQRFFLTQAGTPLSGTNAARLQLMSQTTTNTMLFVEGIEGKMYVVECSEDLIHWTPISTNSALTTVTDALVGNAPRRCYRTRELP